MKTSKLFQQSTKKLNDRIWHKIAILPAGTAKGS